MIGDLLRGPERALVLEVGGDAGGAEGVMADPGLDAGVPGAALNHAIGVLLLYGVAGKRTSLAGRRAKQRPVWVASDTGCRDVFVQVVFQIVGAVPESLPRSCPAATQTLLPQPPSCYPFPWASSSFTRLTASASLWLDDDAFSFFHQYRALPLACDSDNLKEQASMLLAPFLLLYLIITLGFLAIIFFFIQLNLISYAFMVLGLPPRIALLALLASLIGSYVNIPLYTVTSGPAPAIATVNSDGVIYTIPYEYGGDGTKVAINVGGAVVPLVIAGYALIRSPEALVPSILATVAVAAVAHRFAHPVAALGITVPMFIPPLVAVMVALFLGQAMRVPRAIHIIAYVSGVLGTLIGADLTKSWPCRRSRCTSRVNRRSGDFRRGVSYGDTGRANRRFMTAMC